MEITRLYQQYLATSGISTDTRKIKKDSLFFALKGEQFDGNQYASEALYKGAAFAVVSDLTLPKNDRFIHVKDTLLSLQQLATYHRRQLNIPFLAITGTNGKTTTKELVSAVLSTTYQTGFTKGNLNNHIGVPLTLLSLPKETEIAVIEMGANHIGEIDFLCKIAEPTHGVITNIGLAHLEGFGSLEGVQQTKSELYRFLAKNNGKAFVNTDQLYLTNLIPENLYTYLYGKGVKKRQNRNLDYSAKYLGANPFVRLSFNEKNKDFEIVSKLFGRYNFDNILTALAIGLHFKVPAQSVKEALEGYISTNNRSQICRQGTNTFYLDAYNANPTSMKIALQNFGELEATNKLVVLGSMLELGEQCESEHKKVLNQVAKLQQQKLINSPAIIVGKEFEIIESGANSIWFATSEEAKDWLVDQSFQNQHILVKGSRGIRLEKILAVD